MITEVSRSGLREAARIHSVSWQESHRSFCTPEFIALHTPEHQEEYLRDKMARGTRLYMLVDGEKYLPEIIDGHSVFRIPVTCFDWNMAVIADTTAMSQAHEIEYSLRFDSASLTPAE